MGTVYEKLTEGNKTWLKEQVEKLELMHRHKEKLSSEVADLVQREKLLESIADINKYFRKEFDDVQNKLSEVRANLKGLDNEITKQENFVSGLKKASNELFLNE